MTLHELIKDLKLEGMPKSQLENLREEMVKLTDTYNRETAHIKKQKALFWSKVKENVAEGKRITNVEATNLWEISELGQREIQIKYDMLSLKEWLSSVKYYLYQTY